MTTDRIPECSCEKTHLTRRVVSGGGVQYWLQCMRCGRGIGQPLSKSSAIELARRMNLTSLDQVAPWDQKLKDDYENGRSELWRTLAEKRQERWDANKWERSEAYQEYLRSAVWRSIRDRVMKRANWKCEGCGIADAEEVHHLKYPGEWGAEFLFDLVALCRPCHERIHGL